MKPSRQALIDSLADGLEAVRPVRPARWSRAWLLAAVVLCGVALWALAPFRGGALHDFLHTPRLMLRVLLGAAVMFVLARAGFALAVPAGGRPWRRAWPALGLLLCWLLLEAAELWWPSLAPSMHGKRAQCLTEGLVFGTLTTLSGLALARRLWPAHGAWSGALLGLGAGLVPALLMEFACMLAPAHVLSFHVVPGLLQGLVGAALGAWWLTPRAATGPRLSKTSGHGEK